MKTILRKNYLETLNKLKDVDLIKVITGLRRSGKSTLLEQFREQLSEKVSAKRIQEYNFERRETFEHRT